MEFNVNSLEKLGYDPTLLLQIKSKWNVHLWVDQISNEDILSLKQEGNKYFKEGNYALSIEYYTEGILQSAIICPVERSILYCNRAASFLALVIEGTSLDKLKKTEKDYFNECYQHKNPVTIKKYYELGLEAEKSQFDFYLPHNQAPFNFIAFY